MMLEREHRRTSGGESQPVVAPAARKNRAVTDIEVATLLTNARLLRVSGESDLALNLLRTASNRDSKNPAILRPLAEILEERARFDEAARVRAVLVNVDYGFESVSDHARILYLQGDDEAASNRYYEALSLLADEHPLLFEIYKNMGNIFVRRGDFEGAEEFYNKAHAINPCSDVLMVNFGTLEVQRGEFDRSLTCFRRAVEINPSNDRAWTGLAMVHDRFGDFELAWGDLERALDINAGNRTAVHLAAMWAMRDSTPQRAIDHLEIYLETVESDEEMSLVLVNLFCASGRVELAAIETEKVLAWNPGRDEVRDLRRRLNDAQGGA